MKGSGLTAALALALVAAVGCQEQTAPGEPEAQTAEKKQAAGEQPAAGGQPAAGAQAAPPKLEGELVLYAGRNLSLTKPLIRRFEKQTGVKVQVRDGKSGELAALLVEEGDKSKADLFWAQDAGSLSQVEAAGLLTTLPEGIGADLVPLFRKTSEQWVPTSGRARVIAYNSKSVKAEDVPKSVFDLADAKYSGRVGWAPTNASFQAFVTAMRVAHGDEKTEAWLRSMKENQTKAYPKNTPIIRALGAGEIDLGLPNHYYLLRQKKADSDFPVEQTFFADGDIGNLVNVAGVGVLKSAKNPAAATAFVRFLLSPAAQQYFTSDVLEYPVTDAVIPNPALVDPKKLAEAAPEVDLKALKGLPETRALLRKVGLL